MEEACLLCEGPTVPWLKMPLDGKRNAPTPFCNVVRCSSCRTGQVKPQPQPHEISELYNLAEYYTQNTSHMPTISPRWWDTVLTKLAWWNDRPVEFCPKQIQQILPQGAKILDLGCGDGQLLRSFKELGCDVTGVDPDAKARVKAASNGIEVLSGTAESIPEQLRGRIFDLVLMTHSLEHCRNPYAALRNAYEATRPGGLLYVEVPNSECVYFQTLTVCAETFDAPRHLWFFESSGLGMLLTACGYKIDDWKFTGFTRHHNKSWREWERTIYSRLKSSFPDARAVEHTFAQSCVILARSVFASDKRKYDCLGALARRPSDDTYSYA